MMKMKAFDREIFCRAQKEKFTVRPETERKLRYEREPGFRGTAIFPFSRGDCRSKPTNSNANRGPGALPLVVI